MRQLFGIDIRPSDIFSALSSLNLASLRLRRRRDARAIFPDVYAIITRRVAEEVNKGANSMFLEPAWIGRLAGLFAERYFESLTASLQGAVQPSTAWRLAYEYAAQGLTLPVHDALLGINAHINFDLAQGIYDNILAAGAQDDERLLARYHHDHDAVNRILEAAIPDCLELLASRYGCPLTRIILRSEHVLAACCRLTLAMLKLWRERVWSDVLALLAAKKECERGAVIARMNRESGFIASVIGLGASLLGERSEPRAETPRLAA
jgi:hypothetical protein